MTMRHTVPATTPPAMAAAGTDAAVGVGVDVSVGGAEGGSHSLPSEPSRYPSTAEEGEECIYGRRNIFAYSTCTHYNINEVPPKDKTY